MATNIGPKIGIDGEKQFRSELNSIGQQLRTLNTEMKAVTTAFDANESSQKRLATQSDVLTRQLRQSTTLPGARDTDPGGRARKHF